MDLRGIANGAIQSVNPDKAVTVYKSTGFTIGSGGKQVPSYAAPVSGFAQLQALNNQELAQLDGLNITGVKKSIYFKGELAAIVKPNQQGGDLVYIGTQKWLVVQVFENWDTWTKAAIVYQGEI